MNSVKQILALLLAASMLGAAPKPKEMYIPPAPPDGISHGVNHVGGQAIPYTARAGTITLRDAEDRITARMFYVAYTKDGASATHRPVTFFYNGGPGSSTIWLRMASYGPVRVAIKDGYPTPPAPYTLLDNPESLLDKTDMVFVDAPNTGYSRIIGYGKPADFIGVDQDGRAFTQFIQRYLTQFDRWNSPKFLFGESYGTTRDAVLVNDLQDSNVQFNGVVFLSAVLNFGLTGTFGGAESIGGGDWAYVLYLPSEAAAAWYHHRIPGRRGSLQSFLSAVQHFASTEYMHALAQGDQLTPYERDRVITQLHNFTGLSTAYLRNSNMRVAYPAFQKELLRSQDRIVGRFDARFALYDQDQIADYPQADPSDVAMNSAVVSSWNNYVRDRLHFNTNMQYRPTAYGALGQRWDMHHNGQPGPVNVTPDIAAAMSENPNLHVFLAGGYYDFATPYYAAYYTFEHMDIAPALQHNITYGFYPSGHMVYLNRESRVDFKRDLARWYDLALRR